MQSKALEKSVKSALESLILPNPPSFFLFLTKYLKLWRIESETLKIGRSYERTSACLSVCQFRVFYDNRSFLAQL